MTTSAHFAASAGVRHLMPAASTFWRVAEPAFSATATSGTPLSLRLLAWPKPWLP